jgi:hypothetical protein
VERLEDRTVPTAFTWIGGAHTNASSTSGDPAAWTNSLNWLNNSTGTNSTGLVPGAGDTALFSDTVNFSLPNPTTGYTHPFNKNVTYNVTGGGSVGAITFDNSWASTFTVNTSLNLGGPSEWDSGTFSIPAGVTLTSTGTLSLATLSSFTGTSLVLSGNGELKNTGTISYAGDTPLDINSSIAFATRLTNQGTFDLRSDVAIYTDSSATITNTGTLRKSIGAGGLGASALNGNIAFATSNLIDVRQGNLRLNTSTVTGTAAIFTVASGAELDLTYSATVGYEGTFSGSGAGLIDVGGGGLQLAADTTFNFSGNLFHLSEGGIDTNGKTLTNAGTLTIDGNGSLGGNGTLSNTGTILQPAGGSLSIDSATLLNQAGATYDLQADGSIFSNTGFGTFTNLGTLLRSTGGSAVSSIGFGIVITSNNLINVQQGTLQIGARSVTAAVAGSTFTVASGATLDLADSANGVAYQGSFTGSGTGMVHVGTGPLQLAGATTFNFPAGMLHWNSNSTIDTNGNTLTNAGALTIDGQALLIGGGTLSNTGTIAVTGSSSSLGFQSGTANATTLTNQAAGIIDLQADVPIFSSSGGGTLTNLGTLRKSAGTGTATINPGPFSNTGTVQAQAGTLAISNVAQVSGAALTTGTWTVANAATLNLNSGTAVTSLGGTVLLDGATSAFPNVNTLTSTTSTGSFTVQNGRNFTASSAFSDGGTLLVGANSTVTAPSVSVSAGGTLGGTGTVAGPVTNAGTLSPGFSPGLLTINGNYSQTGALAIELNGTTAGTQYDQLRVNGTVSLGGPLNLSTGFAPAVGTQFTIVNNGGTGAVTGTFAGLAQGALTTAGGLYFQISYTGGASGRDVVLTRVIPPTVTAVGENAGAAQRSMVTSIQVTFSAAVTIASGAFTLTYLAGPAGAIGSTVGGFSVSTAIVNNVTVATLSGFTGTDASFGSLIDGRYSLKVTGSAVTASGVPMAADFTYADSGTTSGNQLYRLYGDGDGNRVVNQSDLTLFRAAFGSTDPTFDVDANGVVNQLDLVAFRTNFGTGA